MTPVVNVLVAASRQDHPHHTPALSWLEAALNAGATGRPLAILPMVASGFLRLLTLPKVFVEPTPIESAQAFLHAVLDSPGVVLLPLGEEWVFLNICARGMACVVTLFRMPGLRLQRSRITYIWLPSTKDSVVC